MRTTPIQAKEVVTVSLTPAQIAAYEATLLSERERISESLRTLEEEMVISGISDPEGDVASDVGASAAAIELHDRNAQIARGERSLLEEIDAALLRITAGTYGRCVESGEPIPSERLDALPWADRCMQHAGTR